MWGAIEGTDTHKQSPAKKHSPLVAKEPGRKRLERVYVFIHTDSKEAPDGQRVGLSCKVIQFQRESVLLGILASNRSIVEPLSVDLKGCIDFFIR